MKLLKSMLTAILSILLAFIFMLTFVSCDTGDSGGRETRNKNLEPVEKFKELTIGETIYILPDSAKSISTTGKNLQIDDLIFATSLQGLVARNSSQIYIGKETDQWVSYIKAEYGINFETVGSLEELFDIFKDDIKSKTYVKFAYEDSSVNTMINQATTIASAKGSLLCPINIRVSDTDINGNTINPLEEYLKENGFTVEEDLIENIYSIEEVFEKYKGDLNKEVIGVLDPQMKSSYQMRDYIIAMGAGVYVTDYSFKDEMFKIYETYEPLALAIGCGQYKDNMKSQATGTTVKRGMDILQWSEEASAAGIIPVLTNKFDSTSAIANLSLFSALDKGTIGQIETNDNTPEDESEEVHYVSVLANFGNELDFWTDAFDKATKLNDRSRGEYPIGYTMTPMLYELMPQAYLRAYEEMTQNEVYIASPGGFGAANLEVLSKHKNANGNSLDKYLERTNDLLNKADMPYVSIYGSIENTKIIDEIASLSSVHGGFILTENYKVPTETGIYFKEYKGSNGEKLYKVFAATREVVRSVDFNPVEQISKDSVAKLLTRLSTYGKDKTKAEAYTLLQIDVTGAANSHAKIVSQIFKKAPEGICFVTPDQFLDLINKNVGPDGEKTRKVNSVNKDPEAYDIKIEIEDNGITRPINLFECIEQGNNSEELIFKIEKPENDGIVNVLEVDLKEGKYIINYEAPFIPDGNGGTDKFYYTVSDGTVTVRGTVTVEIWEASRIS